MGFPHQSVTIKDFLYKGVGMVMLHTVPDSKELALHWRGYNMHTDKYNTRSFEEEEGNWGLLGRPHVLRLLPELTIKGRGEYLVWGDSGETKEVENEYS